MLPKKNEQEWEIELARFGQCPETALDWIRTSDYKELREQAINWLNGSKFKEVLFTLIHLPSGKRLTRPVIKRRSTCAVRVFRGELKTLREAVTLMKEEIRPNG